jgi:hypothetical protein
MERREKLCLQQEFGAVDLGAVSGQSDGGAHLKTAEEINQSLGAFVAQLQQGKS